MPLYLDAIFSVWRVPPFFAGIKVLVQILQKLQTIEDRLETIEQTHYLKAICQNIV